MARQSGIAFGASSIMHRPVGVSTGPDVEANGGRFKAVDSTKLIIDGIHANMKAVLLSRSKQLMPDGAIVEIVIWQVPEPVPGSQHFFKYRLYYGRDGQRIIGFDNERGKGDHCHLGGKEIPYRFTSIESLLEDFRSAIRRR